MKQINIFAVKYAMFARQNMLFVKNTGIKDFSVNKSVFFSGSCLMANNNYVAPPAENLACMAMIIYFS